MTEPSHGGIPEEWRQVARKDWGRIRRQLEDGDPDAAGYFLQQSIEKYLKAFLIQHGWTLRKIHVLHELLTDAIRYQPALASFRQLCERVSGYYLVDRYPPLAPSELTSGDVQRDLVEATRLIQTLFPQEPVE